MPVRYLLRFVVRHTDAPVTHDVARESFAGNAAAKLKGIGFKNVESEK